MDINKRRRPTIADVAKLAGFSIGTTSQALNNKGGVAEETVAKVLDAAKRLNYHPSLTARHLRDKWANILTLHIITPPDGKIQHSLWSFYFPIIQGFMSESKKNNFRTHLEMNSLEELSDNTYLEALVIGYHIHGAAFIIPYIGDYPGILRLSEIGCRVVTIYSKIYDPISFVKTDDHQAAKSVIEWLQSLGHEKIGFINGDKRHFASAEREKGYLEGTVESGYQDIYDGNWTIESGVEGLKYFISKKDPPTAIFCANDHMAMGVQTACKDLGISIPYDLSLVGFDDNFICKVSNPQLTTVKMPLFRMGEEAATLLIDSESNESKIIPSQLIIRKSAIALKRDVQ